MPTATAGIFATDCPGLRLHARGKVRDVYDLGDTLLVVATDRMSAFDVVLPTPIPDKGRVLTALSVFWFEYFGSTVPHHFLTAAMDDFPATAQPYAGQLAGRSMLVKKCDPLPVECVARGYLFGSGWKEYQQTGAVSGVALPPGLPLAAPLDPPIFTPATKATSGHDENISERQVAELLGADLTKHLKGLTLDIYRRAAEYARTRGLILADTKFEFGRQAGDVLLIDEVLTPDSSRYWSLDDYAPGASPPSFDKQFVRDYLEQVGWNKLPPAPPLPAEVVEGTRARYLEACRLLTGNELP